MGSRCAAMAVSPVMVESEMLAAVSSVRCVIETDPTMDMSLVVVLDRLADTPVATAVRSPPLSA